MNLIQYFKNNQNLLLATIIVCVIAIILFVGVILLRKHMRAKKAYKEQLESATEALAKLPHSEAQDHLFLDPVLCEETRLDNQLAVDNQDESVKTDGVLDCEDKNDEKVDASNTAGTENAATANETVEKTSPTDDIKVKEEPKKQSSSRQAEVKNDKFIPTRPNNKTQAEKPVKYSGKWLIYVDNGRYGANLVASNGEVLLRTETYTALSGIKSGIETIKNNVAKNNFAISLDKNGNYFFKLYSSSTRLLCISEGYSTKAVCESAIESVKRFAKTAVIEIKKEEKPADSEA